jgi:hypothetical protein
MRPSKLLKKLLKRNRYDIGVEVGPNSTVSRDSWIGAYSYVGRNCVIGKTRAIAFQKFIRRERRKLSFHPARLNLTRFDPLSVLTLMMLRAMRLRAAKLMGALSLRAR